MNYQEQVVTYRIVSKRLLSAISFQKAAHAAYEVARDTHDDKRRSLVLDGIPGFRDRSPHDLREAAICRALVSYLEAMRTAREQLRAANADLEHAQARNVWSVKRCARCTLFTSRFSMPNIPLPPAPGHRDTVFGLRELALKLMDAADQYEVGKGEAGQRQALKVAAQITALVKPTLS